MPLSARRARGGLAVVTLVAMGLAGCAEPTVLRVVDGREVRGRFVSDYAYALYGRAAYEEAMRGERSDAGRPVPATSARRSALAALEAAASDDAESAHLWTAVGALRCRAPGADFEGADAAFDRASGIDPEYAPLYRELAQCRINAATAAYDPAIARARRDEALENIQRAVRLDPDDVAAASVAASLLVSVGRAEQAR